MAVLPTRLVPGLILAAAFGCIGLETGWLVAALRSQSAVIPSQWCALPLFALALFYVRYIWRDGAHRHPVRCITALSPRSQAVIFGMCLGIGLSAGAILSLVTTVVP